MQDTKDPSAGNDRPDKLMSTSLYLISGICKRDKSRRFRGLYTLLNKTNLRTAFYKLNSRAARGVDHEADIKSFFDNIDHEWMVKMLELRVDDKALIRLIRKWLKAGVLLPTGKVEYPQTGSPQGGIVSPILANIYLHYCLDLWFVKKFKTQCRGMASLVRYADDFVAGFQFRGDASMFMDRLKKRLNKFGLELCEDKTRQLRFSRFGINSKGGNGRFDFLGFEFKWQLSRKGKAVITTETSKSKLKQTMQTMKEWVKTHRNYRMKLLFLRLRQKLQGYYNYYGVRGNYRRMNTVYRNLVQLLYKWLNRRSQRRSFNWSVFEEILAYYELPAPRIVAHGFGCKG
ncbi:MAG: hypothetical protein HQK83_14195 [Fibrobacteria bacterium]|nr:hypothetical protein [Fibrobacteria bacterium]